MVRESLSQSRRDDVAYWGLTPRQAAHHHARVVTMYAEQAKRFSELSAEYRRKANILSNVSLILLSFACVLFLVSVLI